MHQYISKLSKADLFNGLSSSDLENLLDLNYCILSRYPRNTVIIQEEDLCRSIGFVLEGSLAVQQATSEGNVVTVKILEKNNSFGEALLFSSNPRYKFSLTSSSDSTIFYVPFDQTEKLLKASDVFSTNYIAFLSNRISEFKNTIKILAHKDVRTRLLIYLAGESRKAGSPVFELPHSKTEIADILGVARPSVSRELQRMQQDDLIRFEHRHMTILKPELF
ncbi:Crp/Fnr family transcriptional regulator [Anaerobium acetethylicum]|uniref:cAMP-binding domain of CRP or a regulatory subunit of cAMP-dependent protein kinases n=1 Tax=Anaerobium acetethylicum TaxID=1619234 RepID=A0A1D3TXH5_9FIRM|nr:Crp/Fnr family transcriptional regulator [Anaerobium acetethylicum]SCP99046.1 cAMP-binding domain of CRP or a regulatory subunit of cAMP-dependent protein kinases [Anaerobium acetethylicum]